MKQAKFYAIIAAIGATVGCGPATQSEAPVRPSRPTMVAPDDKPSETEEQPAKTEEKSNAAVDAIDATKPISLSFYTVEHYGEDRNVEDDLKATIARAIVEKKHILLQVGGEWCGWCKLLTGFIEKNEPIRSSLEKNYLLMKVTYTQKQPNEAFLSKYPAIKGYPHLFVLDAEGKLLHSQDTTPLEEGKNSYNLGKILEFLDEWKPK